jgi:DNA-binding transcriptional MerR regulator
MAPLYRISVAAAKLGVHAKTIRRWEATGKIACPRTSGGH